MLIDLAAGAWRCSLAPRTGGAVAALSYCGSDVFRPSPTAFDDVLAAASFPLVPFANRIGRGLLPFAGTYHQLAPDPIAPPHAIHGHGWRNCWQVTEHAPTRARLSFAHEGGSGWSWRYRVEQEFVLSDEGLAVTITIENREPDRAMPAGSGMHPYFPRTQASAISAGVVRGMWDNHPDGLAASFREETPFGGSAPVPVSALAGCDNYFAAADPVCIHGAGGDFLMGGDAMTGFHVYVPVGEAYFCVEPVSHALDAFGRGEFAPGDVLAPLEARRWTWWLRRRA